jgi:hypothetical protein
MQHAKYDRKFVSFLELFVVVEGCACSQWSWLKKSNSMNPETIMDRRIVLADFTTLNDKKLPAGKYRYNFSFDVPPEAPSSLDFESLNFIQYGVSAELVVPWSANKKDYKFFEVKRRDDLNSFHHYKTPVVREASSKIGLLSCASGHFEITVGIPFSVYTPGSKIDVTILISNNTSKPIILVSTRLIRKIVKRR